MSLTRVTLTLDRQLVEDARLESNGNFSRFIGGLLQDRLDALRRQRLREELRDGYVAEAANDLEIACEYQYVDDEIARSEAI